MSQISITNDTKTSENDVLPEIPKSFTFRRDEFSDPSFDVDTFVKIHRRNASLEQLREDLSSYLRILRLSMVELINHDYADFVNLSSNLMGLDKSIGNLANPLRGVRDNANDIEKKFSVIINTIDQKLNVLNNIHRNKSQLLRMMNVMKDLEKADKLLNSHLSNDEDDDDNDGANRDSIVSYERIAMIITKIEVNLKFLNNDIPLVSTQLKPRYEQILNVLSNNIESCFFSAITNDNQQLLESILTIYSLNGKHFELEKLFRQRIVRPYMYEVICENFLEKYGMNRFFEEILKFIDLKCTLFINITNDNFKFMINSVWKEIASSIIVRTPSLFSPGNPDVFHHQFTATNQFIENFIMQSKLTNDQLYSEITYVEMIQKFNTEVYFHIRFQQISSKFEQCLQNQAFGMIKESDNSKFKLMIIHTLFECITICWSAKNVFLPHLFGSFWKLTLLLLSRYSFWLQKLQNSDIKVLNNGPSNDSIQSKLSQNTVNLCLLINESEIFLEDLKMFYNTNIRHLKPSQIDESEMIDSLNEAIHLIDSNGHTNLINLIKMCLFAQCDAILKQVNDVPRLYRKTNRDIPVKSSNYVYNCVDLLNAFYNYGENSLWKDACINSVLEEVTSKFKDTTTEVLTSVQKIEDSLKRLKKAKTGGLNTQNKSNAVMSDDDKIRLQIIYDIETYGNMIEEKLKVKKESVTSYLQLQEMAKTTKTLLN